MTKLIAPVEDLGVAIEVAENIKSLTLAEAEAEAARLRAGSGAVYQSVQARIRAVRAANNTYRRRIGSLETHIGKLKDAAQKGDFSSGTLSLRELYEDVSIDGRLIINDLPTYDGKTKARVKVEWGGYERQARPGLPNNYYGNNVYQTYVGASTLAEARERNLLKRLATNEARIETIYVGSGKRLSVSYGKTELVADRILVTRSELAKVVVALLSSSKS